VAQKANYFIYPQHLPFEKYKSTIGLGLADLPEDQVEEVSTFIRAPLFNYQALYGLPENFQIYGAVKTNIVTFHFALGPKWCYQSGDFAVSLGINIPTGKDSLSMTQKYADGIVLAPGTVIISAAGEVTDIGKIVEPVIRPVPESQCRA